MGSLNLASVDVGGAAAPGLSRCRFVGALIGAVALGAFLIPISATAAPPSETPWLTANLGATFASSTSLTVNGSTSALPSAGSLAPAMNLGFHFRTPRFDVGFTAGGLGSGSVRGLAADRSAGHKFRFAPSVRWRYLNADWGALFLRVSPGVAILDHSDAFRAEVASAQGNPRDIIEGISQSGVAFHLGTGLGFTIYVAPWLATTVELEIATTIAEMQDGTAGVRYTAVQPIIAIGFEARL